MLRTFLKKVLPWLVAVGVFVYLFRQYPPENIYNSLKYIDIPLFCFISLGYFLLMFVLDTFSISKILNTFGYAATVKELLPARGVTYLPMVVNYAAGQAAFAFYQYRKHGTPISKMLGIFGIIAVTDLYILATLAFITTFFTTWPFSVGNMNIAQFVRIFAIIAYGVFAALLIVRKAFANTILFKKIHNNKFLDLIAGTKLKDYISVGLYRLPVHAFIMGGMYIAVMTFNAHIPLVKILSNIPIVFFIASLPITPGGLGTGNVAIVELFKPFVTSNAISGGLITAGDLLFSFSLVWTFVNYLMKVLVGLICLKFVSKDLFKPTEGKTEEEAEEESIHIGGNI